jgi:hypothetical protein
MNNLSETPTDSPKDFLGRFLLYAPQATNRKPDGGFSHHTKSFSLIPPLNSERRHGALPPGKDRARG